MLLHTVVISLTLTPMLIHPSLKGVLIRTPNVRSAAPVWFLPPPPPKSTTTTWGAAPPSALLAANYSPEGHLVNAHLSFHGLLTSF